MKSYPFDGGDILGKMGAVWFVSYCYFKTLDSTHRNWQRVSTAKFRISVYSHTDKYYRFWLQKVLEMNDDKLELNSIGLKSEEIKKMAKELLGKIK